MPTPGETGAGYLGFDKALQGPGSDKKELDVGPLMGDEGAGAESGV